MADSPADPPAGSYRVIRITRSVTETVIVAASAVAALGLAPGLPPEAWTTRLVLQKDGQDPFEYDAVASAGSGGPSPSVKPAAPALTPTAGSSQVSLAWTDGAAGTSPITSHNLYRGLSAGALSLLGSIPASSPPPYADTGLTNGTTYYYALSAVSAAGEGALSSVVSAVPASASVAPAVTLNAFMTSMGDSREAKAGSFGNGSTSRSGLGGLNLLYAMLDGIVLMDDDGNFGISSSSSLNLLRRLHVANNAATGNTASADTGLAADANFNQQSSGTTAPGGPPSGQSTPTAARGKCMALKIGLNDQTASSFFNGTPIAKASMQTINSILNDNQAAGIFTFLSNECATGRRSIQGEALTINNSQATAANTTAHACVRLTGMDTNGKSLGVYTDRKGQALTANGQFNVTTAGVYTFFAGDPIVTAFTYYDWGTGVAGVYQYILHLWMESTAANFTYNNGTSTVDYQLPGALYGRDAWVEKWDTWTATADPSTTGPNTTNKSMLYVDDKHPAMGGNFVEVSALYAAFQRRFPNQPRVDKRPTGNIVQIGVGPASTAATSLSGTLASGRGFVNTSGKIPAGTVRVLVAGVRSPADVDQGNGTGLITGSNYTATINYTTLAYTVSAAAGNIAQNATIELSSDGGANLVQNGLLDPALGSGGSGITVGTGFTTASRNAIPLGLTLLSNTALQTAINNGNFTLVITNGTRTLADGTVIPTLLVSGSGVVAGTLGVESSIGFQAPSKNIANRLNFATGGDRIRASVYARCLPGPDGHAYGSAAPRIRNIITPTSAVTRPGPNNATTSASILISTTGGSASQGSGLPGGGLMDEHVAAAGGLALSLVSAPVDVSGVTPNANGCYAGIEIPYELGKPVSFTAELSQVGFQVNG